MLSAVLQYLPFKCTAINFKPCLAIQGESVFTNDTTTLVRVDVCYCLLVHAHSIVTASRAILEITIRNDIYFKDTGQHN